MRRTISNGRVILIAVGASIPLASTVSTLGVLFSVTVQETGGAPVLITDNAALDTNSLVGAIRADTAALNLALVDFEFVTLGASSNAATGTPGSDDAASLSQTGEVVRVGNDPVSTLSITVSDNNFTFPSSNPKFMGSSASDTFTFVSTGDSRSFQSFFDPGNIGGAETIPSPLLVFVPPPGIGPVSTSGTAPLTLLGTQPTPFAITSKTQITLGPEGAFSDPPRDQFTGATIITAIPEPAAAILGCAGLIALVLRPRRVDA